MASALLLTHERHSNVYSAGLADMMKRGANMAKASTEAPQEVRVLKRKSMSLNQEYAQGASGVVTVDVAKLSREQRSELRKKLKRGLEEVRLVVSRIDTWLEVLSRGKGKPLSQSQSQLQGVASEGKQQQQQQQQQHQQQCRSSEAKLGRADVNGLGQGPGHGQGQGRKEVASVISDPASSSGETPRDMPKEMSEREARLARQPSVLIPEVALGTPSEKMKRTPKANQLYVNSEFVSGKDKMPAPEKAKAKRTASGKWETKDPRRQKVEAARGKRVADMLKQCTTLLRKLMTHKHGWVFNEPAARGGGGEVRRGGRAGGEGGEKDVDIDDDVGPAKFAPVVIDKGRESSSSGSDSSDSGSSDSDSDSGSSSGSESDAEDGQTGGAGPKASHDKSIADFPPQAMQDPVGREPASEQKDSRCAEAEATKKDVLVVHGETVSERAVVPEKSPPARQVSPEKQLRAALLKGRFADLIVKSQGKALPDSKNDKVDPEKLKRDREEMERRQREEKARLHAEAKAAEITKRKAEAEAALLEKQKREVEREEARRELQQMERTVEIDENSGILKDLERLRSGPLEAMLGSVHDAGNGEEGSPDGSSTIALQGGSNPLEQLGLFMRNDDEEEDEDADVDGEDEMEVECGEAREEGGEEDEVVDVEDGEIDVD
nr:inner centromere protein A-like [Physcomitrium patens]|eukprot:XP_024390485.1 inner centromere protein A-like [Physcomitrella patens]